MNGIVRVLFVSVVCLTMAAAPALASVKTGEAAPDFILIDTGGENRRLSLLRRRTAECLKFYDYWHGHT